MASGVGQKRPREEEESPDKAVADLIEEYGILGVRPQELKDLIHAYGSAVKRGPPADREKAKVAIAVYLDKLVGDCDLDIVRSFAQAITFVDNDEAQAGGGKEGLMHGGAFSDIATAVFNYMKGMCGRTAVKLSDGTEFVAGQINAANFRAAAAPPEEPPAVFGKVLAGVAAVTATGAVLTDYPARITNFMADVLRNINNDMLPGYATMLSNAAGAVTGAGNLTMATGEIALKILIGVILGILVYNARTYLGKQVSITAAAVVDPATYRGIFMHTIATLRSVGIEADARIRGALVTAYQTFVSKVPGAAPLDPAILQVAAAEAAVEAEAAVPIVVGASAADGAAAAAAGPGGGAGAAAAAAAPIGPVDPAADVETESESEGEGEASSAAASQSDGTSAAASLAAEEGEFAVVSPDSSQDPPAGGRRCHSCGNVFGKTRRAARGKKSKKSGKTAKKGGKKAVRTGSFRKGRKHSKKHRR